MYVPHWVNVGFWTAGVALVAFVILFLLWFVIGRLFGALIARRHRKHEEQHELIKQVKLLNKKQKEILQSLALLHEVLSALVTTETPEELAHDTSFESDSDE